MIITEESFTMMQTENEEDGFAIRIDDGPFSGVMYKFGKVDISEQGEGATMSFDFEPLLGNDTYEVLDLYGNKDLEELAGQILKYMLEVSVNDAITNLQAQNGS
ncbi:hypothetical protein EB151_00140 [archaeon]|nr:hypothetical protein [archaeon]